MSFLSNLLQTGLKTVVSTAFPPAGIAIKAYEAVKVVKALTSKPKQGNLVRTVPKTVITKPKPRRVKPAYLKV